MICYCFYAGAIEPIMLQKEVIIALRREYIVLISDKSLSLSFRIIAKGFNNDLQRE